jgi:hypothetical protein
VFFTAVNIKNIAMETTFLRRHADVPPSDRQICNLIQCVTDKIKKEHGRRTEIMEGDEGMKGKKTQNK